MRIATSQFQATMNRSLEDNQSAIASLTARIATQEKIQVPSDDPVTAVRLSRLMREDSIVSQYRDNIAAIKVRLTTNETYLQSMVNDVNQIHDQLVWAADGSNTPDDLKSMVTTLTSLRDSIYYSANEKDQEGRYIFSGTLVNTAAIGFDAGGAIGARYSFDGNTNEQKSVVGNGIAQTINVNVSGVEALLNQLDTAIDALNNATTLDTATLQDTIKQTMDASDSALAQISGKIATFGGAQNVMETLDDNHANVSLSNQNAYHDLGALDMSAAVTEMNGYNLALQASYKAYSKISGLSLFNIL